MDIRYTLSMPEPQTHLFHVAIDLRGAKGSAVDLVMPVWTPGSYVVRDFARNVQDFDAGALRWKKVDKSRWRIFTNGRSTVRAEYRVWAFDLEVDQNHLDGEHGLFNGAGLFMYVDGQKHRPVALRVRPPRGWRVVTGLQGEGTRFTAPSYDVLVDCPTEIGTSPVRAFRVRGKAHRVLIHGANNWDEPRLLMHIRKIVQEAARLFGGLPYERYVFLYHAAVAGLGGLEHFNSTSMTLNPWAGRPAKAYERIVEVTAHEFFHLWNVKRIRPKALGPFDYEREVYTGLLWVCEGLTSYYDKLLCCRARLYDAKRYLKKIAEAIQAYREKPGRLRQSLAQASFDTWLWAYHSHPQFVNRAMSYYEKGALVGLSLDLEIRRRTRNRRSLDDVMRHLWRRVASKGLTVDEDAVPRIVEEAVGESPAEFFEKYVDGVDEIPFERFLRAAGLELEKEPIKTDGDAEPGDVPWLGVQTRNGPERLIVAAVTEGSPAYRDGLYPDDELVAFDGVRVDSQNFAGLVRDRRSGQKVAVTVFRRGRLIHAALTLGRKENVHWMIVPRRDAGALERSIYSSWLRHPWTPPCKGR
ncbi:MAG: M61 family metallopeptidase [Planctomycetes bacterium]|nr:M61 family metallopeptidase [Planctomycetota bacterium]